MAMAIRRDSVASKHIRILGTHADNKYPLVPLLEIGVVDRPEPGRETGREFYNARDVDSMDGALMRGLRDDIARSGLHNPPIVRAVTEHGKPDGPIIRIDLIAGERRLRSLLRLCQENRLVYDWRTREQRPAQEVYKHVPCSVLYNISDEECIGLNFKENWQRQDLKVKEEIKLVERLIESGLSQEEISARLGVNATWVSETCRFRRELPGDAWNMLLAGTMMRSAAVAMLAYPKEQRAELMAQTLRLEKNQSHAARLKHQLALEEAEDREETLKVVAVHTPEPAPRLIKQLNAASRDIERAKQRKAEAEQHAGVIAPRHLHRAAAAAQLARRNAPLPSRTAIRCELLDTARRWISDPAEDPVVMQTYPTDVLQVVAAVAEALLEGRSDCAEIVRAVMHERGEWTTPDGAA